MEITVQDNRIMLSGMLNSASAPQFEQVARQVLDNMSSAQDPSGENYVLDLSQMTYTSSLGLRIILSLHKGIVAAGGTLTLTGIQPAVQEVFHITGFDTILSIVD